MSPGLLSRTRTLPFSLLYSFLIYWLTLHGVFAQNCVLSNGNYYYDLNSLSKAGFYKTIGDDGSIYYFNFCAAVTLGGCAPDQAVCKLASSSGCGSATNVYLEKAEFDGVKVIYLDGDRCIEHSTSRRNTTINVHCSEETEISITRARDVSPCATEIDVDSKYGCQIPSPTSISQNVSVNIFLALHSHDEVGWKSSMDDYYVTQVQSIINNTITVLQANSSRKFLHVEQAYFSRFWQEADNATRTAISSLVANGQLSFPLGGWVMPDEATPTYSSLITQLTEGHQFLKQTFNYTPTVSWQVDSFGSNSVVAELYKQSNFSGHVIARVPPGISETLLQNKSMQFYWQFNQYNVTERILTHIMYPSFQDPFKQLEEPFSTDQLTKVILDYARKQASFSRSPNVLIPLGGYFSYANYTTMANLYDVLDKVIETVSNKSKEWNVTGIRYSNLTDYFTAVNATKNLPTFRGDFMPYSDNVYGWWTGFYTSRPALKGLIRESESVLRASESLFSVARICGTANETYLDTINSLVQAVSVGVHHQAITGTSTPQVVTGFSDMLNNSLPTNREGMAQMLDLLLQRNSTSDNNTTFNLFNLAYDEVNVDTKTVVPVVVYNSLAWLRHDYVSVKLAKYNESLNYIATYKNGTITNSQVIANFSGPVLYFKVVLPPVGYQTYFIRAVDPNAPTPAPTSPPTPAPNSANFATASASTSTPTSSSTSISDSTSASTSAPTSASTSTSTSATSSSSTSTATASTTKTDTTSSTPSTQKRDLPPSSDSLKLSNKNLKLYFSNDGFSKVNWRYLDFIFQQRFLIYESHNGSNPQSDAYVFRPAPFIASINSTMYDVAQEPNSITVSGGFLDDIYQAFSYNDTYYETGTDDSGKPIYTYTNEVTNYPLIQQHIRVFKDDDEYLGNFVEISHSIGALPRIPNGRELIARFITSVTNSSFFTDNNGYRFAKRIFDPKLLDPISGNYYPTVYASYMLNSTAAIGFIWDRSHGITSATQGNVDVMLHRRLTTGDEGITLDDDSTINPTMRVIFGNQTGILQQIYRHIYLLNFRPVVTIGAPISEEEVNLRNFTEFSMLNQTLPPGVHMVDLKAIKSASNNNTYILRLAHLFDVQEVPNSALTRPVVLNLRWFFNDPYCISSLNGTYLTANKGKEPPIYVDGGDDDPPTITLHPKQIRTFLLTVEKDKDNCVNVSCGNGKCVDLRCTYTCSCDLYYFFDHGVKRCVKIPFDNILDEVFGHIFQQLPLTIIVYLAFVCAYSIRSELKKIAGGPIEASYLPRVVEPISVSGRSSPSFSAGQSSPGPNSRPNSSSPSSSSPSSHSSPTRFNIRHRLSRFMQANKRVLERVFFPTALQNRHQD